LWAQGKEDAAIQRERLWDEFAQVYDVDIWCGCLLGRNDREQERDIIKRISEEHSAVYSL